MNLTVLASERLVYGNKSVQIENVDNVFFLRQNLKEIKMTHQKVQGLFRVL